MSEPRLSSTNQMVVDSVRLAGPAISHVRNGGPDQGLRNSLRTDWLYPRLGFGSTDWMAKVFAKSATATGSTQVTRPMSAIENGNLQPTRVTAGVGVLYNATGLRQHHGSVMSTPPDQGGTGRPGGGPQKSHLRNWPTVEFHAALRSSVAANSSKSSVCP